jgi:hypothetical protein
MSNDSAKRIAQLEGMVNTLNARLTAISKQRNEALDNAVVSQAASNLQIEHLQKQVQAFAAEIKRLTGELEKTAKPAETPTPPEAPKAHANGEACPQVA